MDPLTAIGAVASIWQIAQAALSLSTTLYTLSSAVGSASEDIRILADDLKTFSQSLSLLSRLLEDSKQWYSDDIYLLTAKIIKDCADLYVKIDKILIKLGSNGKSSWKLRVKFVYKESQIQKLLNRLRDMKGTLATILMSLQVDLQLSLLNISSTSKIQRPPEKPLQPGTLRVLQEAQKSIMTGGILTKYTIKSGGILDLSESRVHILTSSSETVQSSPLKAFTASLTEDDSALKLSVHLQHQDSSSNLFHATSNFMAAPNNFEKFPAVIDRTSTSATISRSTKTLRYGSNIEEIPASCPTPDSLASRDEFLGTRSVKSSSSTESFKSAMSTYDLEVAQKVKAVRSVLHAFRTAIQILENLVSVRIAKADIHLLAAAKDLEGSLNKGIAEIDHRHRQHFKNHGEAYLQLFDATNCSNIQAVNSELMNDLIIKLHEYSAEHEELHPSPFHTLAWRSEVATARVNDCLDRIVGQVTHMPRPSGWVARASCSEPIGGPSTLRQPVYNVGSFSTADIPRNNGFGGQDNTQQQSGVAEAPRGRTQVSCYHCASARVGCDKAVPCSRCLEQNLTCEARYARRQAKIGVRSKAILNSESPGHHYMSLPFAGYPFKRFDSLASSINPVAYTTQMATASAAEIPHEQDTVPKSASSVPVSPAYQSARPNSNAKAQTPRRSSRWKVFECGPLDHKQASETPYAAGRVDKRHVYRAAPPVPQRESEVHRNARIARSSERFEQTMTSINPSASANASQNGPIPITTALQDYQQQLLAVDPKYKQNRTSQNPNQAIELSPAQIEQAKQAGREYRLSIMPGHDPDSKESHKAHSKALQEYQMSLMTLDCGKHRTPRLMMRPMTKEKLFQTYGHYGNKVSEPVQPSIDVLQDFDFDSFLQQDSTDQTFSFDFTEAPVTNHMIEKVEQAGNVKGSEHLLASRSEDTLPYDPAASGMEVTEQNPSTDTVAPRTDPRFFAPGQDVLHDFDFDVFLRQDSTSVQPFDFGKVGFRAEERKAVERANKNENLPSSNTATTADGKTENLGDQSSSVLPIRGGPPSRARRGGLRGRGASDRGSPGPTPAQAVENAKQDEVFLIDSTPNTDQGLSGRGDPFNPSPETAAPHGIEHDEPPLYVNAKQFHRILKRRMARQELQDVQHKQKSQRRHSTTKESSEEPYAKEIPRDRNDKGELPLHSSTRVPHLGIDLNTEDVKVELAWMYPALSTTQTSKLWWQAYISLMPYGSNAQESPAFTTIKIGLESELGILASRHIPDDIICRQIGDNVRRLETVLHQDMLELADVLETRSNILRILNTVEEQLGLEIATLAWSCVSVLLSYYERLIAASPSLEIGATSLHTLLTHLQDIVAIIARYAVMETLYQQSGNSLSLKPEYRSAILSLCSTVLEYFAAAFECARAEIDLNSAEDAKMEGTLEIRTSRAKQRLPKCSFLVELIKQKDLACQGFRVVVDTQGAISDESEDDSADLEEESDDDWERIENEDLGSDTNL